MDFKANVKKSDIFTCPNRSSLGTYISKLISNGILLSVLGSVNSKRQMSRQLNLSIILRLLYCECLNLSWLVCVLSCLYEDTDTEMILQGQAQHTLGLCLDHPSHCNKHSHKPCPILQAFQFHLLLRLLVHFLCIFVTILVFHLGDKPISNMCQTDT